MSTISAGLVSVTNLTVTGTQAGAIQASNLSTGNFTLSGDLDVSGNLTLGGTVLSGADDQLAVGGGAHISGNLAVGGTTDVIDLDVSGNLTIHGVPRVIADSSGNLSPLISQTYQKTVGALSGGTYTLYYNDLPYSYFQNNGCIASNAVVLQFYNDQTVSIINNVNNSSIIGGTIRPLSMIPYTIVSPPTPTAGAVVRFLWGVNCLDYSYNRYVNVTFSPDFKYVYDFVEDMPPLLLTRMDAINNVTTHIDTSGLTAGNFDARLISSYNTYGTDIVDGSGVPVSLVDSSGGIKQYTLGVLSGTVNAATVFTRFGSVLDSNCVTQLNVALLAASDDELSKFGQNRVNKANNYEILSTLIINHKILSPVYQQMYIALNHENPNNGQGEVEYCGILNNCNYGNGGANTSIPSHDSADIYVIDMSGNNFDKRLNGTSFNTEFQPRETSFNGHACLFSEQVYDSSENQYLLNLAVRGADSILIHQRLFVDPAEVNYISGRTVTYSRHNLGKLNDTFWYPNGPEINFNLSDTLSVTKVKINGIEIPTFLVKRRAIDSVVGDKQKVYINIADASAYTTGFTINYVTDASGNYNTPADSSGVYTEAQLNKVEVWYQGLINEVGVPNCNISWNPGSKGALASTMGTLMNNLNLVENQQNLQSLDTSGYFPIVYPTYPSIRIPQYVPDASTNEIGLVDLSGIQYARSSYLPKLLTNFADSHVDYSPSDPSETDLHYIMPIADSTYDEFYCQFEIMCPSNYYAHTGGTHLSTLTSTNGKNKLYRFVPGAKVLGNDYHSCYETAFKFSVTTTPLVESSFTTDAGTAVSFYSNIPPHAYKYYEANLSANGPFTATGSKNILNAIEQFVGAYPFDTIAYFLTPSVNVAMEHREGITQGYNEPLVVIHEYIHQWWQNMISQDSNKLAWIDEGFDTFMEYYVQDVVYKWGYNNQYMHMVDFYIEELSQGFGILSIRDDYGFNAAGSYHRGGYIFGLLNYNWGASYTVDGVSGKTFIRLLDSSNNVMVNISDPTGALVKEYGGHMESFSTAHPGVDRNIVGFNTGFDRSMYDSSGVLFLVNSAYKILDASGNPFLDASGIDISNTMSYATGLLDASGNIWNSGNNTILTGYTALKLPTKGNLSNYYRTYDSSGNLNINTNFWNAVKNTQNIFKGNGGNTYTYETFVESWAQYAQDHASDWGNKWPSTKQNIYDFFNETCNAGSNLDLSTVYRMSFDNGVGGLLPSTFTESAYNKVPSGVYINNLEYVWGGSTWRYGITKYFNVTTNLFWLTSDGINPLLAGSQADFVASAAYYTTVLGTPFSWTGKGVLIKRGTYTFALKTAMATQAGCNAAILYNNVAGSFSALIAAVYDITIPLACLSGVDGNALAISLTASPTKSLPLHIYGNFTSSS